MHTIYRFISPSGKSYIGQTTNLERRIKQHQEIANRGGGFMFHRAIRRYGLENFNLKILADNIETAVEAIDTEKFYISFYATFGKRGYNLTEGGEGVTMSPMTRAKISRKASQRVYSEEYKQRLSEIHKKRNQTSHNNNNNYHKSKFSPDIRRRNGKKSAAGRKARLASLTPEEHELRNKRISQSLSAAWQKLPPDKKLARETKRLATLNNKSPDEIKQINAKKAHHGLQNINTTLMLLISPTNDHYFIIGKKSLKAFCDTHKISMSAVYKNMEQKDPIQPASKMDSWYKTDREYAIKRDNAIDWCCIKLRRIKI